MFVSNSSKVAPRLNTPGTSLSFPTYDSSSIQYSSVKKFSEICTCEPGKGNSPGDGSGLVSGDYLG